MKHFGTGLFYPHMVVLVIAKGNKNDYIMFLQKRSQFFVGGALCPGVVKQTD